MAKLQHGRKAILKRMLLAILVLILGLLLVGGVRLYLLQRQVDGYKAYWQARAAETPAPDALWYVALGDSTAQGIGASRPEQGYVGLLADSLQAKTGRPVHVVNLSVTGARLEDLIEHQLPQLEKLHLPGDAVVTLGIGSNNIRAYQPDQFRAGMETIIRRLPPQAVVGDVPYFGGGRGNSGERSALAASQVIAELAAVEGLRLAELHRVTSEQHSIRDFAADFFHPSSHGYRKWHQAFLQTLEADSRSI